MSEPGQGMVPIAIVGMSCRLPGASNLEEFWQLIEAGGDATGELPADVLDRELYYDPRKGVRGKTYTTVGGLVPRRPFDNEKCRLSPELLQCCDDAQLTACEVAYDALRDASYDPHCLPAQPAGVYFGHTGGTTKGGDIVYSVYIEQVARLLHDLKSLSGLTPSEIDEIVATISDEVRQRCDHRVRNPKLDASAHNLVQVIARAFQLDGPNVVVDAACASSLQALALGARALQLGEIEMAVVGGASHCKSDSLVLFSAAQSVSAAKSCPFDDRATGLVTAEGYVALVLKTLPKAVRDGDRIRCVIRGIGMSADGRGKSLWAPRKEGQIIAVRRAYPASLQPEDVQYLEAHATSTQVGDATELAALAEAFPRHLPGGRRIPLGSVKGNIGHTLETAGVAGLVKAVLAMEHGLIPPIANLEQPNSTVAWEQMPFSLPTAAEVWNRPADGSPRLAAVNSFGIGGLNVHVLLEEYLGSTASGSQAAHVDGGYDQTATEPIAVIGLGAILPGADNAESFWNLLKSGRDPKTDVTPDRWDPQWLYDPTGRRPYTSRSQRGGFVTNYRYDWRRHKVPPKQVATANPLQFMLLDATEQALEQAGYLSRADFDRERVGVVVGTTFGGDFANQLQVGLRLPEFGRSLRRLLQGHGMTDSQLAEVVAEYEELVLSRMPALIDETGSFTSSTLASRITKTFDLKGGALALDGGIGSGLAAIGACMDALWTRACDVMICAVGQRHMDLYAFEALTRAGVIAPDGQGSVFDRHAEGYLPGEGCGVLLLKRLADAQRDGDTILAVLQGAAASAEWGHPGAALGNAAQRAMDAVGTTSQDLVGIETLSTLPQTTLAELGQFGRMLASSQQSVPTTFNSIVSQFGYLGAAHAMAATIKAILSVSHRELPAGMVARDPDPQFTSAPCLRLQQAGRPLDPTEAVSIGISCGSDEGPAYHLIVGATASAVAGRRRSAPARVLEKSAPGSWSIVRIGAGSWEALRRQLDDTPPDQWYRQNGNFTAADRARLAIVCQNTDDLAAKCLQAAPLIVERSPLLRDRLAATGIYIGAPAPKAGGPAFLFPGQGSQYPGMLGQLIAELPEANHACRMADAAMAALGFDSFQEIAGEQANDLGHDVWKTQVSMLLADYIVQESLVQLGLSPAVVAGHSFGEYPALVCAGVLSLTDAIRATRHRCQSILDSAVKDGGMVATNAPREEVEALLTSGFDGVYIANLNAPDQIVIAGFRPIMEQVVQALRQRGFTALVIKVPCPFHTPLMAPTADLYAERLANIQLRDADIPVISTATGHAMTCREDARDSLVRQLTIPVDFGGMLHTVLQTRPALVVEAGPRQILTQLCKKNCRDGDTIFLSSDVVRRPGPAMLLGVLAQADCLGCRERQQRHGGQGSGQTTALQGRVVVYDATERRTTKMREAAHRRGSSAETRSRTPGDSPSAPPQFRAASPSPPATTGTRSTPPRRSDDVARGTEVNTGYAGAAAADFRSDANRTPHATQAQPAVPLQPAQTAAVATAAITEVPQFSSQELQQILVSFVVEQTGYPEDIVELDADLEADLGIDSIKKAQLFGEVGERFAIAPRSDLSLDDFPTLRHVQQFLLTELGGPARDPAVEPESDRLPPAPAEDLPLPTVSPVEPPLPTLPRPATTVLDQDQLRQILVSFVIEQTGYPEDIIEFDADLEADLGIDSIKKAQLFGEVGERFQIAPRADLSLDDFPTLEHVVQFLVCELDTVTDTATKTAAGTDGDDPTGRDGRAEILPAAAPAEPSAPSRLVSPASPSGRTSVRTDPSAGPRGQAVAPSTNHKFFHIQVLEGGPDHVGRLHGSNIRHAIQREIAGLIDGPGNSHGNTTFTWPARWSQELDALAAAAEVNRSAVVLWNQRHDALASLRTTFVATGGELLPAAHRDTVTLLQVRKQDDGIDYLTIGRPGKIAVPAGTNAAGLAVSWERRDAHESAKDIISVTDWTHTTLASARTLDELRDRLKCLSLTGRWCLGASASDPPGCEYWSIESGRSQLVDCAASLEQASFHASHGADPHTLLLTDRQTGTQERIGLEGWLRPPAEPAKAAAVGTARASEPTVMRRHVLRMTPASRPPASRPTYRASDLIGIVGGGDLAGVLREQLLQRGCRAELFLEGHELASFTQRLSEEIPHHLVVLTESGSAVAELEDPEVTDRLITVFELCQRWLSVLEQANQVAGCTLAAVTRMGGDLGFHSEVPRFTGGGLAGLLKGMRREYPTLRVKLLDCAHHMDDPTIASELIFEMNSAAEELEVGIQSGRRCVVQAVAAPVSPSALGPPSREGVWVVSGGGRGVTAAVARELGRRFGLKLHLLGTTPLPSAEADWRHLGEPQLREFKRQRAMDARQLGKDPADALRRVEKAMELDRNMQLFQDAGVQVTYHECDLSDRSSLSAVFDQIRDTDGPIAGILHGAGIESACRFVRKRGDVVRATITSKCDGAANLIAVSRGDPLEYFIGFGSTSGRFGGLGQADYSLASDLLAKMIDRLAVERPECVARCFHWPAWAEVGMAVRPESKLALERAGLTFMPVSEGVEHVVSELLAAEQEREILILDKSGPLDTDGTMSRATAPLDPATFRTASSLTGAGGTGSSAQGSGPAVAASSSSLFDCTRMALIDAVRRGLQEGEFIADVHLDSTQDPFLIHHRLRGRPFLPGIISMEMFAEAAALLHPGEIVTGLRDAQLVNGWTIDTQAPTVGQIRLHDTPDGVRCELRGPTYNSRRELVASDRLYASAVMELGTSPPAVEPIDPGTPLFDWFPFVYPAEEFLIFHGPPFRTLSKIDFIHGGGRAMLVARPPDELIGDRAGGGMLIAGAALDGCMYACGTFSFIMVDRRVEIPGGIDHYRQKRLPKAGETCRLRLFLRQTRAQGKTYDFMLFGEAGDVILQVEGFHTIPVSESTNVG